MPIFFAPLELGRAINLPTRLPDRSSGDEAVSEPILLRVDGEVDDTHDVGARPPLEAAPADGC